MTKTFCDKCGETIKINRKTNKDNPETTLTITEEYTDDVLVYELCKVCRDKLLKWFKEK